MHISKLENFLGVSTGYFSRLVRLGKQPKLEIVVQLCEWYGCSLDFLCYVDLLHKSKEEIDALLREDREKNYEG
jgi:transcriptional regulator with XRE-family HTH domain